MKGVHRGINHRNPIGSRGFAIAAGRGKLESTQKKKFSRKNKNNLCGPLSSTTAPSDHERGCDAKEGKEAVKRDLD